MKQLFAPWRRAWVTSPEARGNHPGPGECLFCRVWSEPATDVENLVVLRGTSGFVLMNRFPYNGGHLLVAPVAHEGALEDLSPGSRAELMELAARALRALRRLYTPHAFNLGINQGRAAGAGIPDHVHLHIVPRWDGDTNFMTAVGDARVISEDLAQARTALAAALAADDEMGDAR